MASALNVFHGETYDKLYKIMLKGCIMQDCRNEKNLDKFPVAMAYVPWQKFDKMYDDLDKAYHIGTIFPELNKPFTGRRCVQ